MLCEMGYLSGEMEVIEREVRENYIVDGKPALTSNAVQLHL